MAAGKKKILPWNSASLKEFYFLSFLWNLKEGIIFLSWMFLFLWFWLVFFFWMAHKQHWTHAAPWQLCNGAWYSILTKNRPQQLPSSANTALPVRTWNNSDPAFLIGFCFSESGKSFNWLCHGGWVLPFCSKGIGWTDKNDGQEQN